MKSETVTLFSKNGWASFAYRFVNEREPRMINPLSDNRESATEQEAKNLLENPPKETLKTLDTLKE